MVDRSISVRQGSPRPPGLGHRVDGSCRRPDRGPGLRRARAAILLIVDRDCPYERAVVPWPLLSPAPRIRRGCPLHVV